MNTTGFDAWLEMSGPVAVVVQEELEPVLGQGAVFFPPTFAPPEGSKDAPGYVIDETSTGRVALVDTVGSQANRMEPLFKSLPYSELVPRARIKIGEREIDLLDAGHRAADAVVRFSDKWAQLRDAFVAIKTRSDATALAKMAPTSLVFGMWDSRDTQVKLPRIVGSTIRAYEVERLTRSAQYFTSTEKDEREDLGSVNFLSDVGLNDAPAGRTAGGVISRGGIRRLAVLNLVALRALSGADEGGTRRLQRYILGLALVSLIAQSEKFLREGCLLVPTGEHGTETKLVDRTGKRTELTMAESEALEFARAAAAEFGVGDAWTATFSKDGVKQAAAGKTKNAK
jgi:CRISPR-associated protein Csb1